MTLKAHKLLREVEVVIGYSTYVDLIESMLSSRQETITSGMGEEKLRANKAIELAEASRDVALISSGDPGIYGMAGLALEMIEEREKKLKVEVVPGVTAAAAAASSLGAPLMHDQAYISLSDHLTPWEHIAGRLEAAARADLIAVLYNPRSSQRKEHIKRARDIFLEYRTPETPVGIVRSARRGEEERIITTLEDMLKPEIDMLSLVIIGSTTTEVAEDVMITESGAMITPRGYEL